MKPLVGIVSIPVIIETSGSDPREKLFHFIPRGTRIAVRVMGRAFATNEAEQEAKTLRDLVVSGEIEDPMNGLEIVSFEELEE